MEARLVLERYEMFRYEFALNDLELASWRDVARLLMPEVVAKARAEGYEPSHAPPLPKRNDNVTGFIKEPFRVLKMWIPEWIPHEHAGRYVITVDLLAAARPPRADVEPYTCSAV
jgi:hypothetical protein